MDMLIESHARGGQGPCIVNTMVVDAPWLLTQPFIQAQTKENIKAPRHWPLWGEFTGDRWIHRTKGQ